VWAPTVNVFVLGIVHIGASDTLGEEVLPFSFLFFPRRYEKATPSPQAGEIALYLHQPVTEHC
jgi:hypothetical protein